MEQNIETNKDVKKYAVKKRQCIQRNGDGQTGYLSVESSDPFCLSHIKTARNGPNTLI